MGDSDLCEGCRTLVEMWALCAAFTAIAILLISWRAWMYGAVLIGWFVVTKNHFGFLSATTPEPYLIQSYVATIMAYGFPLVAWCRQEIRHPKSGVFGLAIRLRNGTSLLIRILIGVLVGTSIGLGPAHFLNDLGFELWGFACLLATACFGVLLGEFLTRRTAV